MNREREHKEKVIRYYNITQPFYEWLWYGRTALGIHYGFWMDNVANRKQAIIKENEVLANMAGVKDGDLVLDAGCGVGGSGIWLSRERQARVVGLNIVQKQLLLGEKLAKKRKVANNLHFVRGDYESLPFKSECFDIFWSLESIEHSTNPDALMKEAFRVLKPQGKIIIAAGLIGKKELSEEEIEKFKIGLHLWGPLASLPIAEEVADSMETAGFTNVENHNLTNLVMRSSEEMTAMCRWGLPVAKFLRDRGLITDVLVNNNQWGLYQESLFRSGALTYNVLLGQKP